MHSFLNCEGLFFITNLVTNCRDSGTNIVVLSLLKLFKVLEHLTRDTWVLHPCVKYIVIEQCTTKVVDEFLRPLVCTLLYFNGSVCNAATAIADVLIHLNYFADSSKVLCRELSLESFHTSEFIEHPLLFCLRCFIV